jgi:hypothetical protein
MAHMWLITPIVDKGYRVWYVTCYMETTHVESTRTKGAALNSLAIVGFVALIIIGILATIYAASFIPKMLNGSGSNGSAAAYLSGLSDKSDTTVTATTPTTPSTVASTPLTPVETPKPTTITNTIVKYVTVPSSNTSTSYSGLADLTITITDKGYLRSGAGSFVSSSYVPSGYQGAVRYRITNTGSNVSGSYRVDIRVETNSGTDNDSVTGNSLAPGRSVEGTGSFDANAGGTATIRLTVDADNVVSESNENNNTDSTSMAVNGYGYNTGSNNRSGGSYDSNGNYCTYGTFYSNSRYYCNMSNTTYGNGTYDSNGTYCTYGTYQQNNRYYCRPYASYSNNSVNNNYDSNGNYCTYGVYESAGRFYCNSSNGSTNVYYNNRDSGCVYGSYIQNGTYYCY